VQPPLHDRGQRCHLLPGGASSRSLIGADVTERDDLAIEAPLVLRADGLLVTGERELLERVATDLPFARDVLG
jgi:hypothetical protein